MDKILIIQSSPPHTGSTVLVNILHGLLCADKPVIYSDFNKDMDVITKRINNNKLSIIKSHNCNIDGLINKFKRYNLFFICSERDNLIIDKKYKTYKNVLSIDYKELLESDTNSIKDIADGIYNKLLSILPAEIILNNENPIDDAVKRIQNMNDTYELIKNRPFSYVHPFYHIHGHHKNRKK
jgi:hypothetical protein